MIAEGLALVLGLTPLVGTFFLIATGAQALGVYVEQAGAAVRFARDQKPPESLGSFALMVVTTMSPALLLLHAYFMTVPAPGQPRVLAISLVIASVIVGAIVGRLVGMAWQSGARFMRGAALPINIAALVLAIYATRPTLTGLYDLFTTGHMRLTAPTF